MAWRRNAVRIYRALLFAYPAAFRHEYGDQMGQLFEDRLQTEPRLRVWFDTLTDLAITVPKEHFHLLAADLRHGLRVQLKSPAFTAVACLVMALGIGLTTTVFSLINAVLIRSLPYADAARLVYVWTPLPRFKEIPLEMSPSLADYYDWHRNNHSFSSLAMFQQHMFTLVDRDSSQRMGGARVSGNFFATLDSRPQLGRAITEADDHPGRPPVIVIGDPLWHSRFGGDPLVLGKTLRFDHTIYQIVGVMPPGFGYPHNTDFPYSDNQTKATQFWIPAALSEQEKAQRFVGEGGNVVGRLAPGVSLKQAQVEMSALEARLDPLYPPDWRGWVALVRPFIDTAVGPVKPLLWLLFGAVALVLLIACCNVANLLMARAAGRVHEMGVRTALGALRARLVRQMLTEAMLLASAGGALGALFAVAAMRLLLALNPGNIPRMDEISIDARVLLFAVAVSIATGLAFGLFPALAASRVNVVDLLKQAGRGLAGASNRFRNALIVVEVALAVILLAGAGLLIRSYAKVQAVDPGFSPSTLTMSLMLGGRYATAPQQTEFFHRLMDRVATLPGVSKTGIVSAIPLAHHESMSTLEIKGHALRKDQLVDVRVATPGYFEAMGIHLLDGRLFRDASLPGEKPVVIVSQSFARAFLPGESVLGQQIRTGGEWQTVIGVVSDVRLSTLEETPRATLYASLWDTPVDRCAIAIGATLPAEQVIASVRTALHGIDTAIGLEDVATMNQRVSEATGNRRFQTVVLAVFAICAVLLALVGLYGLLAYAVRQRTAELGIRMALGASAPRIVAMVLRQGMGLVTIGLIAGVIGAFALTRILATWVYGVTTTDPLTFVAVPLSIFAVALIACLIPAWRATRIDPLAALRYE